MPPAPGWAARAGKGLVFFIERLDLSNQMKWNPAFAVTTGGAIIR